MNIFYKLLYYIKSIPFYIIEIYCLFKGHRQAKIDEYNFPFCDRCYHGELFKFSID